MKILFLFLFFTSFYGCKVNSEEVFCKNELLILKGNLDEVVELDFGLNRTHLINSIQSQIQLDLCSEPVLNAFIKTKTQEFEFSLLVFPNDCKSSINSPNIIKVLIDQNNAIIVNNHLVNKKHELADLIKSLSKKTNNIGKFKETIFLLEWDIGTDVLEIKSQIEQIIKGITNYSNELSLKKFSTPLCNLEAHQLEYIDSEYKGILGLAEWTGSNSVFKNPKINKELKRAQEPMDTLH